MQHPNPDLLALGIQQPWAELILRGLKTIELRTVPARPGTTVYLYSARRISRLPVVEEAISRLGGVQLEELPLGRIVGTVDIGGCRPARPADARAACVPESYLNGHYSWLLSNPQRCPEPLATRYTPYGMWFYPFRRLSKTRRTRKRHGGN